MAYFFGSNLRRGVDIPETNGVVVTGAEQVAVQVGVPGETVALLYSEREESSRFNSFFSL